MSVDDRSSGGLYDSPEVAERWRRSGAARGAALGRATELMLDLADVGPGRRVLDVGAGTGEQMLPAARRIGPSGMIVAIDTSATMLEVATSAAREAGLSNVVTRVMDAQQLDLQSDSFDAAIARSVLMLIPDPVRALMEIRRVLKPGGSLAAIVFSTAEKNPYASRPREIVRSIGSLPSDAGRPGMFALAGQGVLKGAFQRAGFRAVEVQPVPTVRRIASVEAALQEYRDSFPSLIALMSSLSEDDRQRAWDAMGRDLRERYGSVDLEVSGEVLVGVGVK